MSPNIPSPFHQVRHRCRNPRCGAKLKRPVGNPRDAFCCESCFTGYYRSRCLVCERPFTRKTERRRLCGRRKCESQFRRHAGRFLGTRYRGSVLAENASRSAHSTGLKIGTLAGRAFRKVAGPELTATSFRLATLPLDPELVVRLDRAHAGYFEAQRKAKRTAARRAQIKRRHPPVNVLGGYKFPGAPAIDLSSIDTPEWAIQSN